MAEISAGVEQCNQKFPKEQKTAVARARCLGEATAPYRTIYPYPDLYDQETAGRNMLAEKWQKGQITQAEYEFQFTQMHSQIEAEGQRRNLAGRSVNAQETAATAALLNGLRLLAANDRFWRDLPEVFGDWNSELYSFKPPLCGAGLGSVEKYWKTTAAAAMQ
jgi:hypothetical protein